MTATRSFCRLTTLAALALIGCGGAAATRTAATVTPYPHRFDSDRAYRSVAHQVALGQRPAGSAPLRGLAEELRLQLPHGHFESIPHEPRLRNVVGTIPGRRPGIVIGAHYDTLVKPKGFLGANNGGAGTAIVVEAARALARMPAPRGAREVRFVLFDGEEPAAGLPEDAPYFYHRGLRGSRAYTAAHKGRTSAMVLLDYVGNQGLRLPREGTSSLALWTKLRAAAQRVGAGRVFPDTSDIAITDDHTPFLRGGIDAVDLIDWSYPGHELSDTLDKISRSSLDAVGETVVELVRALRAR